MTLTYDTLTAHITQWAADQSDIQAVIAVGSQARGDADLWSDLDLLLFTANRDRYLEAEWLGTFGKVWLTYMDKTGLGDPEWFVIYDGGLKADIVLLRVDEPAADLEDLLRRYPYQGVFRRGIKVLFDRHGEPRPIPPQPAVIPAPPSAAAFDHTISGLLLESVTTAKFIARGDFWRAQHWLAYDLRSALLRLVEWHSHGRDTWYNGRFLNTWADPRVMVAMPNTFALYERESLTIALLTLLDTCRFVGEETAQRFGFTYPHETQDKITSLIETILATS
jgi:aminoglycoside 6-adenylyltransferase